VLLRHTAPLTPTCRCIPQVAALEDNLESAEQNANEQALLLASAYFWHSGKTSEARRIVDKVLPGGDPPYTPLQQQARSLRGWIDLTEAPRGRSEQDRKSSSIMFFETEDRSNLSCLMGKAKYHELHSNNKKALEALDLAVVQHSWCMPALLEKAKNLVQLGDWDQANEVTSRVLSNDRYNIVALTSKALYELTRTAELDEAGKTLNKLRNALGQMEPDNADLHADLAVLFANCSGRDKDILEIALGFIDISMNLQNTNSSFASSCGSMRVMAGDLQGAMERFRAASKFDESNVVALHGMIQCQLKGGQLHDASQQLEFLSVIQDDSDGEAKAEFAYLQALLALLKDGDSAKHLESLDKAVQLLGQAAGPGRIQPGEGPIQHLMRLQPDFTLELAREYLNQCGTEPIAASKEGEATQRCLESAIALLTKLTEHMPGLLEAKIALARARFISNDMDNAGRLLVQLLQLNPSFSGGHLLSAKIALVQEKFKSAESSLEQAVSLNFEVRTQPEYVLVKASVLENMNKQEEALKLMEEAMAFPGVRAEAQASFGKKPKPIPLDDRVSVFIRTAELHTKLNNVKAAAAIIKEALSLFKDNVQVIVANSELAIKRGDFKAAVAMLNNVTPDSAAYMKAQMVKANIYLTHRRDKRLYIQCYQSLVEHSRQSMASYIHLGEAHMRIQEPDKAIDAYETALRKNPQNSALASKIGKALVSTHDYLKAIDYYENALRTAPDRTDLSHSLAELYAKLQSYDQAARVLEQALDSRSAPRDRERDATSMKAEVKNLLLLASVHAGAENADQVPDTLMRARLLQQRLLEILRGEASDVIQEQKNVTAEICFQLAEHYRKIPKSENRSADDDKALQYFNEALKADDTHTKSMAALARLHLKRNELEACQHQCVTLMRIEPDDDEPSMMLADVMFRRNEYDQATFHFQQLLERKPNNYYALSHLIALLRRAGKLTDADHFLKAAERHSPRAVHLPGLNYCKGLYHRYVNSVHEATKHFNLSRRDSEWGKKAIVHMVEIYLNPDNENLWDGDAEPQMEEVSKEEASTIGVAEKLLRELPQRPKSLKHLVLEAYAMMATKNKANVEAAIQKFIQLLEQERDYVPALLGMATGFMMQKQMPKARNQLKRISKMNYDKELADDFERSYLLLADIYIQRGKYDLSQELCKRCLSYNRSCAKAWEYMGLVMEKEQVRTQLGAGGGWGLGGARDSRALFCAARGGGGEGGACAAGAAAVRVLLLCGCCCAGAAARVLMCGCCSALCRLRYLHTR
jgi:tetratricopeptide repeat protein 21B